MRHRTAALLFGAAAATGAAAIGAATAVFLAECSADRIDRHSRAMMKAFFTMPRLDAPEPPRPRFEVLRGGLHAPDHVSDGAPWHMS